MTNGCAWNAVSAFANCGRAVAFVRGSYGPKQDDRYELTTLSLGFACRDAHALVYLRCVDVMPAYYAAVSERRRFLRV